MKLAFFICAYFSNFHRAYWLQHGTYSALKWSILYCQLCTILLLYNCTDGNVLRWPPLYGWDLYSSICTNTEMSGPSGKLILIRPWKSGRTLGPFARSRQDSYANPSPKIRPLGKSSAGQPECLYCLLWLDFDMCWSYIAWNKFPDPLV